MRNSRKLLLSSAAAAFFCLAAPVISPLVSPAAARGFNSWEGAEEVEDSAARVFLRKHGKLVFGAVPVVMLIIYILIMGPADVADAASRTGQTRRYRGFGSNGGFGGKTSGNTPWF
ncbi:MAG: hypothetical protein Q7R35_04435 [Elusimicrobiota bacterium]|nr:hypothetical protein [Elusimicrobiota bacterium]